METSGRACISEYFLQKYFRIAKKMHCNLFSYSSLSIEAPFKLMFTKNIRLIHNPFVSILFVVDAKEWVIVFLIENYFYVRTLTIQVVIC
jgi:hypothetical protein